MEVVLLRDGAKAPSRATDGSAGYDLTSLEDCTIDSGKRKLVSTGLALTVPTGTYGRVAPRSGMSVKNGIHVGAGVIDRDYTGEVKVLLFNMGEDPYHVSMGDRIAQLVIEKIETPEVVIVPSLKASDRNGGFGSTGK